MLTVVYVDCRYAECRYAQCRYAECHYAECRYSECRYGQYRYAECHYAECRYAECRGAAGTPSLSNLFAFDELKIRPLRGFRKFLTWQQFQTLLMSFSTKNTNSQSIPFATKLPIKRFCQ